MDIILSFLASIIRGFLKRHGYITESNDQEIDKGKAGPPRKKRRVYNEEIVNTKHNSVLIDASRRGSTAPPCIDLVRTALNWLGTYCSFFVA